ncbi:MAG: HNH endonuclease domain-containing protein [Saprospiraceae bacterium]
MGKKILGLDLGTNSIGWALVDANDSGKPKEILGMGSRIIPMGAELSKFEQGQAQTKNANRRIKRGIRKQNKRYKQRRNKLIYILERLGMLPDKIQLVEPFSNPNKIDRICIKPIKKDSKQFNSLGFINLKVKALNSAVSLKELGQLFYKYNQLRGYSGGGSEPDKMQEETSNDESVQVKKKESFVTFAKIMSLSEYEEIELKGKKLKKRKIKIEIDDENIEEKEIEGETYLEVLKQGDSLDLLINITRPKKGEPSITIKLPSKTSWRKKMENLERELNERTKKRGSEFYISEYFEELLNENKWIKIRDNVVLRSRYEKEFQKIWDTQLEKNKEFKGLVEDKALLTDLINFVFPERVSKDEETEKSLEWKNNSQKEKYRKEALQFGLLHLIKNQIIYYQRDLKDQSHLISYCRFESDEKVVSKSHPVFQEYKIWEQINKLTINTKTEVGKNKKGEAKYEYFDRPIPYEYKEYLFDELQNKKEISFSSVYNDLVKKYNLREKVDFLNGLDAKTKLKGNDTKLTLKKALGELWNKLELDIIERQIELWDILYNGKGNEYELTSDRTSKALAFLNKYAPEIPDKNEVAIQIAKIKFSRNYSNLSLKAINKLLPLVRAGKYYNTDLTNLLKEKIEYIYNENLSDPFEKSAQEFLYRNTDYLSHGGILNAFAVILVYSKHTEKDYTKEQLISDYKEIKTLLQGELRNPLAEQIINEALMLVKEIWRQYGEKPSEIRLELARELKNSASERQKLHTRNQANQKENGRIKERLREYKVEITNANIEKFKLWMSQENLEEKFVQSYKDPSKSEVEKMKLWEEQGHVSPYTGKPISLSALFDKGQYDIDHIIPKSRYFDDSFTNKIICETSVNKDKGNRTAMEYFEIGSTTETLLNKERFIDEVNKRFTGKKRQNLLATKVPEDPITRQIKDTQYIATRTKEELYKIVGNDKVKTTTGGVTDYLRNQWGLTDKFKKILMPRYENLISMDSYLNSVYETYHKEYIKRKDDYEKAGNDYNELLLDKKNYLDSFKQNFIQYKNNKLVIKDWTKRIDHRHHAIDALIVACTQPAHIQRLNNLNKELQDWLSKNRKDLLPNFQGSNDELLDEIMSLEKNEREKIITQIEKLSRIEKPWESFPADVEKALNNMIVSHKPKDKLLIQKDKNDVPQIKLRGQLHQETIYGKSQGKESYKIPLIKFAGKKFATEKTIEKICNEFLRKMIKNHLEIVFKGNKEEAFSAEGILELNNKLANRRDDKGNPKPHTPISKIKIYYKNPFEDFGLSKLGTKKFSFKDYEELKERIIDQSTKESIENHVSKNEFDFQISFSKNGIEEFYKMEEEKFKEKYPNKKYIKINKIKISPLDNLTEGSDEADENFSLQKLNREKSFNNSLFVATGDNYLFAVMERDELNKKTGEIEKKRFYDIITFFDAANLLKSEFNNSPDKHNFNKDLVFNEYFEKKNEAKLLFTLKQSDFVYMPDKEEETIIDKSNPKYFEYWQDKANRAKNIYIVQKYSGKQIYFIKHDIASPIINKVEFGSQNCYEMIGGRSIKEHCIKLQVDRLGNIKPYAHTQLHHYPLNDIDQSFTASEPAVSYQPKLTFYADHVEINQQEAKYSASLAMQERLKQTLELIKRIFGERSISPNFPGKFTIKKLNL